ncbi:MULTISPECIES: restriction endonuclease [Bacillus cereus group]|uniref:restriction endonuclease n=1 Tax=Bacillus cereus group TaxID=86661 RepID=UPI000BFB4C58|nr:MULTISPECIES: restriction endonuclease [Bacillus cereus group]KAA0796963.1 hypothetical protein DN406_10680 [Bacillus sp. BB56-3]MCE7038194.1 restriction endonuclease [Bacillus cereus]PGN22540.1 hypothetical protein CN969_17115 [Bacillus thuringiensis]
MKKTFPKDITDSMRTCILSIFWPKKDIVSFFINNGCTKNDLKSVNNYEGLGLSRSQIIDTVFENLYGRSDGGVGQFRSMLQSLLTWDHFDPYYFKKLKKLDEDNAIRYISHLKQLQEIRDAKLKKLREERREREEESYRNQKSLDQLYNQYINLYQGKDEFGKSISLQQRGYLLENFLRDLSIRESIGVSDPIKLKGEQIDGTIKFDGENYILEAKWHDTLTASNALYHFAYKVEGKFYGRGMFISINGFSKDSIEALVRGKALNTILIDGADLILVVEGLFTFKEILDKKIKAAQTLGKIYIDVNSMKDKI